MSRFLSIANECVYGIGSAAHLFAVNQFVCHFYCLSGLRSYFALGDDSKLVKNGAMAIMLLTAFLVPLSEQRPRWLMKSGQAPRWQFCPSQWGGSISSSQIHWNCICLNCNDIRKHGCKFISQSHGI